MVTIKKYIRYLEKIKLLLGINSKQIPFMISIFLFSSILDLVGIGLIAPYISLLIDFDGFLESGFYQLLLSIGLELDKSKLLIFLSMLLLLVFLIKAIIGIFINRTILQFCYNQGADLRSLLMEAYVSLKYKDYIQRNSSEYIHRIQQLASDFSHGVLQSLLRLISEAIVVFAIIIFLAWHSLETVFVLVLILASSGILYDRFFKVKLHKYGRLANEYTKDMIQAVHEGIEGLKEIRVLGHEPHFLARVSNNAKKFGNVSVKSQVISTAPRYVIESMLVLFIVIIVISSVSSGERLDTLIPMFGIFAFASIRILPSVNQIILAVGRIRFGLHSINLLYEDVEKYTKRKSNIDFIDSTKDIENSRFESLVMKDVHFSYNKHKNILNGISLNINAGESIGLIGPSGSGKTTMIDVLLGLLEVDSGSISLNNINIENNVVSLRSKVAYLPQQVFLIDSSLKNNIALGVKESEIDDKKVMDSIFRSNLSGFISELSDGVDTVIGERGIRISGGQRQRVALARAFYHAREILIMDESTSALDNNTENEIVNEIKSIKGSITTIVIAHRLSTLKYCDRVYELKNGKIYRLDNFSS
jgi:ATP-binding cassette, subfamily B, bacterial PglK